MSETAVASSMTGVALNGSLDGPAHDEPAGPQPQYIAYRPPGSHFTPPASPRPATPSASIAPPSAGFHSLRSKRPANLQMDVLQGPAYERPVYSPSPSSSPTLPPSLPSPHLLPRQRAPSLLRHIAVSSPLNDGFPRAEQPLGSPTFASVTRQGSGPGPTSDPRTIFNPLASNPVNQQSGPDLASSREDPPPLTRQRPRGLTSSSQPGFLSHPPLRAAMSIPDYGQYRATGRSNPSGTYKPDRGGANWSHNDHFPPPHFRPVESRTSLRSAWTNASSSFVDVSGTERSSMVTGRSSVMSDQRTTSVYSVDRSRDDAPEDTSFDDDFMSVEDVIDSYCYEDDEEESGESPYEEVSRMGSLGGSESEVPGLSQSGSHSDRDSSQLTPEPDLAQETPQPLNDGAVSSFQPEDGDRSSEAQTDSAKSPAHTKPRLSPLVISPMRLLPVSTAEPAAENDGKAAPGKEHIPTSPGTQRQPLGKIYNDLQDLPLLPKEKSRLSRQDWAEIQAYSRKNSRGSVQLLDHCTATSPPPQRPLLAMHSPPIKDSSPLPEVDEDDAYPRRASTSVFDRRSTLLELTKVLSVSPPSPSKTKEQESRKSIHTAVKRQSSGTVANSPVSPVSSVLNIGSTPSQSSAGPPLARPKGRLPVGGMRATERDRYGFKKATDKISVQQYDAWYSTYEQYVARRRGKWIALMERNNLPTTDPTRFPEPCEKVRRYTRKGYPPEWRGAMWWFYANGQKKLDQMRGVYKSLVARVDQGELNKDDREAIERDLDRTFPDNIHFRPDPTDEHPDGFEEDEPHIVRDLRQVLQCFALNNPGIGYCQSLNFIAGLLLLFMKQDVEKVFILLTIITQTHLPGAHARSLANTEVNVLMMLIKDYLPKVWASINDTDIINNGLGSHAHPESKFQRQPTVALSCTSWFMSLFVGVLPIEVVLRVWDAFLYEGPRALFRYALAIFKLGEPEIRKFHPGDGELFMTVQNLPRKCLDPNVLHDIAFVKRGFGSLTLDVIEQKRGFWEHQVARDRSFARRRAKGGGPVQATVQEVGSRNGGASGAQQEEEKKGRMGLRRKASASRRFFRHHRER
ncbi:uncharacterized protein EI97DRAFT_429958 [Westerdykella ornata]|uniref:Rab-GAP TBC domain-containing protein n=1 Tax=Westerdykella ornata TaxID=318751 RepID=A0A6A6JUB2_WESOR|nr:uncharacterized protein EI97DRAFT_429958 [Westerdykella ornata]KAF2280201.1 hypothetical protein EI97DRAFT_429958 [Westerdykella ornata]